MAKYIWSGFSKQTEEVTVQSSIVKTVFVEICFL